MFLLSACSRDATVETPFVVTITPLKLILQEITGDPSLVGCILPPGASPHSYELRPSTARSLAQAKAVFYVDESVDGWAARLAPGRLHPVFSMVPASMRLPFESAHAHDTESGPHHDSGLNAHFWPDPAVVAAVVPALVAVLSGADPGNAERYAANGARFQAELTALEEELRASTPVPEDYVLLAFHPSWSYYFHRFGINVSGYIEPFPGKEPTPQALQALQQKLAQGERRVVLSEVQLPSKPADVLAEALGAHVTVIDPLGGPPGRDRYADLLRYNAERVREALQ